MSCAAESMDYPLSRHMPRDVKLFLPQGEISLLATLGRTRLGRWVLAASVFSPQVIQIEIVARNLVLPPGMGQQAAKIAIKRAQILIGHEAVKRRVDRGIKQKQMAGELNWSRANLSDSETGRRLGGRALWQAIDTFLHADGELVRWRDRIVALETAVHGRAIQQGLTMPGGRTRSGAVAGGEEDPVVANREIHCPGCGIRIGVAGRFQVEAVAFGPVPVPDPELMPRTSGITGWRTSRRSRRGTS